MLQSPKSKRAKGASEKPSSDTNSETRTGGHPGSGTRAPSGSGKPTVPAMDRGPASHAGGVAARDEHVPSGAAANNDSGSPGMAKSEDAMRHGGLVDRFGSDRGRNS